jgi:hypothetical protein
MRASRSTTLDCRDQRRRSWWCSACRCTTSACRATQELDRRDLARRVTFRYYGEGPEGLLKGKTVYVA